MICPSCHVKMTQSRLVNRVFLVHEPGVGEIMRALKCPLFGASTIPEIPTTSGVPQKAAEEPDIPALWRTTGHWNAVWARTK